MTYKLHKGIKTIAVSGQDNVVSELVEDTVTLVAGSNVTLTTDASADSITIAASGSSNQIADSDGDTKIQVEESSDEDKIRFDTGGSQRMVITDAGKVGIGVAAPSYQLDINGDVRVRGNNIRDGGGNSAITFDGSANTQIDGTLTVASGNTVTLNGVTYTFPTSDGSSGQFLSTNGSGTLSFATASGGGSGIASVAADSTPQLGGDLDVNGNDIVSASNGDITITPNGSGDIILDGQKWPQADGSSGQYLTTNGSGQLSWGTVSGGGGSSESTVTTTLTYDDSAFDLGTNSYTAKDTTISALAIAASKTVVGLAVEIPAAWTQNSGSANGEMQVKIGDVWYRPVYTAESYGYISESTYWLKNHSSGIYGFVGSRQSTGTGAAVQVKVKGITNDTSNSGGYVTAGSVKITIYYT